MPLPSPAGTEDQSDFVSRCVSELTQAGEGEGNRQRVAICNAQWRKGKTMETATEDPKKTVDAFCYKTNAEAALAIKAEDEQKGNGVIMGHAAVFNNVDHQGDIIRPGAFKRTIKERVAAGKVPLMVRHMAMGGDTQEIIGTIVSAREDKKGLFIEADLMDAQVAQETRSKILQAPKMFGMSVGFKTMKSADITDGEGKITGKELLELALFEVTVTALPANDRTTARAKTEDTALERRVAALEEKLAVPAAGESPGAEEQPAVQRPPRSLVGKMRREIALLKAKL